MDGGKFETVIEEAMKKGSKDKGYMDYDAALIEAKAHGMVTSPEDIRRGKFDEVA
jgi:hypothetical protein